MSRKIVSMVMAGLLSGWMFTVGCAKCAAPTAIDGSRANQSSSKKNTTAPAATTGAARDAATVEAIAEIDRLLGSHYLRLTTDTDSAAKRFHFTVWAAQGTKDGQIRSTNIDVVRDGERVAVLCGARSGLPYCYMTKDLLLAVDRRLPGGFVVYGKGGPSFLLGADDANRLTFVFTYARSTVQPYICLDLRSLLRVAGRKLLTASFDRTKGRISGETENSSVWIATRHDFVDGEVPITEFMTSSRKSSQAVGLTDAGIHTAAPWNLCGIDGRTIRAIGMPLRALAVEDIEQMDFLVPVRFPSSAGEQKAAERLRELLTMPASSRPREEAPPPENPPPARFPPRPVPLKT